jgi:hypothetical protein
MRTATHPLPMYGRDCSRSRKLTTCHEVHSFTISIGVFFVAQQGRDIIRVSLNALFSLAMNILPFNPFPSPLLFRCSSSRCPSLSFPFFPAFLFSPPPHIKTKQRACVCVYVRKRQQEQKKAIAKQMRLAEGTFCSLGCSHARHHLEPQIMNRFLMMQSLCTLHVHAPCPCHDSANWRHGYRTTVPCAPIQAGLCGDEEITRLRLATR